jgi:hypothetical protein
LGCFDGRAWILAERGCPNKGTPVKYMYALCSVMCMSVDGAV